MTKKPDFKSQSDIDLEKSYHEKREALRGMRFNIAGSKNKNVKEQKTTKKDIARILTELNSREQR